MLAMWSATGARFMIMLSDVVGLRAFVIVMVNLSVRHTRRMPGGDLSHDNSPWVEVHHKEKYRTFH